MTNKEVLLGTSTSRPPSRPKPLLRRWEAAEYLKIVHGIVVAPATLAKWASQGSPHGSGPRFYASGRTPLYPIAELDRWARERLGHLVSNTAEAGRQGGGQR